MGPGYNTVLDASIWIVVVFRTQLVKKMDGEFKSAFAFDNRPVFGQNIMWVESFQ